MSSALPTPTNYLTTLARQIQRPHRIAVISLLVIALASVAPGQTYTVVHTFAGGPADGEVPDAGVVVVDSLGEMYGTTAGGGPNNAGTAFKINSSGAETLLYSFTDTGGDGGGPMAALVLDAKGNLYGTTVSGGQNQDGAIFRVSRSGKEKVLHSFANDTNGLQPYGDLVLDRQGNLYGTTFQGGNPGCRGGNWCGVIFRLSPAGTYTVLHRFSGPDGVYPQAGVIRDKQGNIYGTTSYGGSGSCKSGYTHAISGCGVVFKLDRAGKLTVLHSFQGGTDGQCPIGDLTLDAEGNLYGTTYGEQSHACYFEPPYDAYGTVFKIDPQGNQTVLHNFQDDGVDGIGPAAGILLDGQGNIYGTTAWGGSAGWGTIFKIDNTGTEAILYSFEGGGDGAQPLSRLVADPTGNLYGTVAWSGNSACNCGNVFKLSPQ